MKNMYFTKKGFLQRIKIYLDKEDLVMKAEVSIQDLKRELEKFSKRINNKTVLFIIVGFVIALISILFLIIKIKNKIELLSEDEDFYYDDDDFYEDYHALDYEDDEE